MSWKEGLIRKIKDKSSILYKDNHLIIIQDAYPKSRYHFLALVHDPNLNTLNDLNKSHIHLINHLIQQSTNWTLKTNTKYGFKFGFHAEPSMNRLHLHMISKDFDSIFLKTRKNYNSFNGDFLITPERVLSDLNEYGKVQLPPKEELIALLKGQLNCHFCDKIFNCKHAFAELKKHLQSHYNEIDGN